MRQVSSSRPKRAILFLIIAAGFILIARQSGVATEEKVEAGRFRIFKLQRPVGWESYEVTRDGASLATAISTSFQYIGSTVECAASLRTKADFTPERFEIKGKTSTQSSIDTLIEIKGDKADIRQSGVISAALAPERFFTANHYAPMAIQMMLFRYWHRHNIQGKLKLLPVGDVTMEYRGSDTMRVNEKEIHLERYSVDGIVWGRESIWLDANKNLIAVVSGDAELDRLEAIREGYEAALPLFAAKSVEDGLADQAQLAARIKPIKEGLYALVGGLLIDGSGKEPTPDSVVVIQENRIIAAGAKSQVKIPPGASIVDVKGKTILPGLWDMHAHFEQVEWALPTLAAGVTTVRDAGNEFELVKGLRDAARSGRILGPRMLVAGVVDADSPNGLGINTAGTPEEARAMVQRYKNAGFEQIKIYQSFNPELVSVIADEAHKVGLTITGHVPSRMNAFQFIEAGADQINHIGFVSRLLRPNDFRPQRGAVAPFDFETPEAKSAIKFFKDHGTVIDPSFARGEQHSHPNNIRYESFEPGAAKMPIELVQPLNSTGAPPATAQLNMASFAESLRVVGALHKAGIPIVLGTDLVVPGHSIYRELELAVRAGLTPMEAIQAATIVPARAMKLAQESGTVEAGKRADLILVDSNPLESISKIRNVKFVIANGRMFECSILWQNAGFKP